MKIIPWKRSWLAALLVALGFLLMSHFRECPAYTLLYQFSPKDTGQSKVK